MTVYSLYYTVFYIWNLVQNSYDYTAVPLSLISSLRLSLHWLSCEQRNKGRVTIADILFHDAQPIQYSGEAYTENAMGTTLYSMIACLSTYSCQLTVKVICAIVLFIPPQSSLRSGTIKLLWILTLRKNHHGVRLSWGFCPMCRCHEDSNNTINTAAVASPNVAFKIYF